ncbi:MAG: DUF1298 domain-containing protein, partial [Desulfuromusa sp.]|nr:DUF1298 domain-containing protein [Desulfuromusa sp.]
MSQIHTLDYAFLLLETEESPKHVGSLEIMQPPKNAPVDYVSQFVEKLRQRKPAPPFNYKLKAKLPNLLGFIPGISSAAVSIPQWRVASSVDMEQHVIHHVLPEPGSFEQLNEEVLKFHKTLLKRDRPMWECHIFEGLEEGRRFAVYTKMHHAITDGMLASTIFALNSSPVEADSVGKALWELPEGWVEPESSETSKIGAKDLVKSLIDTSAMAGDVYTSALKTGIGSLLRGGSKRKSSGGFSAPITRLNQNISSERTLAFDKIPLDRLKILSKSTGISINNLLLTICDMAYCKYLARFDEEPKKPLVALMPMTTRTTEIVDASESNSVIMLPVKLGKVNASPIERLRTIVKETDLLKETRATSSDSALASTIMLAGMAQLEESLDLNEVMPSYGNFVFSNVPGPREKRYRFDARIDELYPVSCLGPGVPLNITTYSYGGFVFF